MKPNLPVAVAALAVVIGCLWAGLVVRTHLTGAASVIDRFETVLVDIRIALAGARPPPEDIVIVAIDDGTIDAIGPYPLPRDTLAELVGKIGDAGARALAVDILLFGASDEAADASLAAAIGTLPTVIAGAGQMSADTPPQSVVPAVRKVLSPALQIAKASSVGLANIATDTGGTPRHMPMLFLTDQGLQPSLGLQAAGLYQGGAANITEQGLRFGDHALPLDLGWHLALNYYGPGGTIPTVSALDVLQSPAAAADGAISPLKGRMVVLGVTATGVGDRFSTPFDPIMPGVEVQATGIANLLDGMPLHRDTGTRRLDGAAAVLITLCGMLAVLVLPLAPATVFYLLLLIGWLAVSAVAFANGTWLNAALPFAASLPPVLGLLVTRQVADRIVARQQMQAQEALSRFQSPRLARRIAEDPSFLASPRQQTAAILFVDLSGYTGLSERLGAAQTRDFLKEFHTIVVNVVSKRDGVVLDFMGDGAMLGFGLPEEDPQDPVRALTCAFELEREIAAWLETSGRRTEISSVRVGAHMGQVVLSRLGHDRQQQIAATGDCVNVASRLLEVAKDHKVSVVVSANLIEAANQISERPVEAPRLVTVAIRGRQQVLQVGLWVSGDQPQQPCPA
ncbi:CHASE2 domain-containing protein [Roseibium sediminicola]|uniref:Adenylate/guanylate cyclase domain-containing protein n=1 Tax=Roseibium sediminicola TaxID=2933272 RepID=A0ABT0GXV9_9HYPH|nr:adenylate/guanylate cyclase domain-containing protein [Roseibium sp. CAU 1639]MCK7613645.1 adenylate/guanylate cyclase domain-containing protein [Roseibium sp. CAU 1639]